MTCWDGSTSTLLGWVLAPCGVVSRTPWGGAHDPLGSYLRPYWGGSHHPTQGAAHHPPNATLPRATPAGSCPHPPRPVPVPPPRVSPQRCC